ncbi:(2Fe-2S)-binding protein [Ahrensia sp. R2A130]|uniref:(2Fe-2S)-binding protein n=1 Tax=Ahrensia sp. R2A130 TaxID=744979 RepID=UPI0001E08C9F|nr:(2Fe-2S)-binding protein [Ahrensia sp. R2A130]EFL88121.1 isoquinoline 1-oxidoreductase subunit alpha [Ahrensia sp. R2A130]
MKLTINGEEREIDAPGEMPLLWALRDVAGLKGTKFGCGIASCGACTVLVNGVPRRSCVAPLDSIEGEVTTIEGLVGADGELHPVQKAWAEGNVAQCGYCQSGQIISAVALLSEIPEPTDEDIDINMNNLCRCGTYPQIRTAIRQASAEMKSSTSSAAKTDKVEG